MTSASRILRNQGLTTHDSEDWGKIAGESRQDSKVTFCMSYSCQGHKAKKVIVALGSVNTCPLCNSSDYLRYDIVSPWKINKYYQGAR